MKLNALTTPQVAQAPARAPQTAAPAQAAPAAAGDGYTPGLGGPQQPCLLQPQPPAQPAPGGQPPAQLPMKDWTVLVYSVSDNNLYEFMQTDLDEAERIGSTNEMNLLVETSHQPVGGSVVRMKLEADQSEGLKSPVLQDLGKTHNMSDSNNMASAIAWAMKEYPSKHTMVILSDHGGGWQGANQSESQDGWMNITDIEAGLKKAQELTGKKVDVLGFDECLMASTEVAHQLKDCANYMVGSEEVEGGAGWQYDEALPKGEGAKESQKANRVLTPQVLNFAAAALRARDGLSPADMAKGIVRMSEGHQRDLGSMAAIDLTKMGAVSQAVDNFAGAVLDSKLTKKDFAPVKKETQKFYEFADMGHFVELAGKKFGGDIAKAAEGVKAAMGEAIIAEQHSSTYPNAKGLNIELNKNYGVAEHDETEGVGAVGNVPVGDGLSSEQMEALLQVMVMAMSPEQLGALAAAMPTLIELNAQVHAQGGGAGTAEAGGADAPAASQNQPAQHAIPKMDADKQSRLSMIGYGETAWAKDTRWDEMLQKVG